MGCRAILTCVICNEWMFPEELPMEVSYESSTEK